MQMFQAVENKKLSKGVKTIIKRSDFPYPSKNKISINNLSELLEDKLLLTLIIQEGIPFELFEIIRDNSPFTESNWADFLGISTKSIQRYSKEKKTFKSLQTEKILEIAEVCHLGLDIFGNFEKFKLWLSIPNFALGSISPIKLLGDSYGKELVITELVRIDHGIFV